METGFNAMGMTVPSNRKQNAYETIKQIMPKASNDLAQSIVSKCSAIIERDEPFRIVGANHELDKDLATIDLTGRYRLMAVLLTDG